MLCITHHARTRQAFCHAGPQGFTGQTGATGNSGAIGNTGLTGKPRIAWGLQRGNAVML